MKKNIHVVKRADGQWAVERESAHRASRLVATQREAANLGKELAKRDKVELVIHDVNGGIREKNSFGNDPFPPKG